MSDETELVISGEGMPSTAVRGITETLEPIDNPQFDKYRVTLSCNDKNAPAFDHLRVGNWRRTVNGGLVDLSGNGSTVTIDCISELAGKLTGSPLAYTTGRGSVTDSGRTVGEYFFYRPRLTVGLISKSMDTDEYGAICGWQAEFEEI